MNNRSKAINLFINKTKYNRSDLLSCVAIHKGFTNVSYKVQTNDMCFYQIRLGNDKGKVNRQNELKLHQLLKLTDFIYYDVSNGNAVKKWISGVNPTKRQISSNSFLKAFAESLMWLHRVKASNIVKHNYWDCIEKAKLPLEHKAAYISLIKDYERMPLVLSHNDLSADNLIYTPSKKVVFIDYEWARMNNKYWDVANFIREVNLPLREIKILCKLLKFNNLHQLLTFVYLTTNYAYQWTFNMPFTPIMKRYRQLTFKKLKRYYQFVSN